MAVTIPEVYYAVLLHGRRVGTLCQKGDYTRFDLADRYVDDPSRPVLGLRFEENLRIPYSSALRLPKWFSNLLPEGPLREWIADDRGVSLDREMELLAQVGHDLPGAVQVVRAEGPDDGWEWQDYGQEASGEGRGGSVGASPWRFSLAGVALKFSMLAQGDRLTVPAVGELGDWLVKFPDYRHDGVPRNEFAIMSLAKAIGIDIPIFGCCTEMSSTGSPIECGRILRSGHMPCVDSTAVPMVGAPGFILRILRRSAINIREINISRRSKRWLPLRIVVEMLRRFVKPRGELPSVLRSVTVTPI